MSLKIRLKRAGSKKRPFYRVVVTDSRKARDSRSIEDIGYYNPLEDPVVVNVDREKVSAWVGQGAQLTDTVRTLLKNENSVHPSRRSAVSFVEESPAEREARKKAEKAEKAQESAAAAIATAVAEETPAEEPAAEEPAAEEPAAEEAPAEEPAAEEAPAAEATEGDADEEKKSE